MVKLILSVLVLVSFGCAHISGERAPDGTLKISTTRFLWSSQRVEFNVRDGTNLVVTLRVNKSNSDNEALAAIAEGAARGIKP